MVNRKFYLLIFFMFLVVGMTGVEASVFCDGINGRISCACDDGCSWDDYGRVSCTPSACDTSYCGDNTCDDDETCACSDCSCPTSSFGDYHCVSGVCKYCSNSNTWCTSTNPDACYSCSSYPNTDVKCGSSGASCCRNADYYDYDCGTQTNNCLDVISFGWNCGTGNYCDSHDCTALPSHMVCVVANPSDYGFTPAPVNTVDSDCSTAVTCSNVCQINTGSNKCTGDSYECKDDVLSNVADGSRCISNSVSSGFCGDATCVEGVRTTYSCSSGSCSGTVDTTSEAACTCSGKHWCGGSCVECDDDEVYSCPDNILTCTFVCPNLIDDICCDDAFDAVCGTTCYNTADDACVGSTVCDIGDNSVCTGSLCFDSSDEVCIDSTYVCDDGFNAVCDSYCYDNTINFCLGGSTVCKIGTDTVCTGTLCFDSSDDVCIHSTYVCDDAYNAVCDGTTCYNSAQNTCLGSTVCSGTDVYDSVCTGSLCFDSSDEVCIDSTYVCDDAFDTVCGTTCYNSLTHVCIDSTYVCDDAFDTVCGSLCYATAGYTCIDNAHLCENKWGIWNPPVWFDGSCCPSYSSSICEGKCIAASHTCIDDISCWDYQDSLCGNKCYNSLTQVCISIIDNTYVCDDAYDSWCGDCYSSSTDVCIGGTLCDDAYNAVCDEDCYHTDDNTCIGVTLCSIDDDALCDGTCYDIDSEFCIDGLYVCDDADDCVDTSDGSCTNSGYSKNTDYFNDDSDYCLSGTWYDCKSNSGCGAGDYCIVKECVIKPTLSNGDGTILNPYVITNCTDLQNARAYLSSYFELGSDIDCSGFDFSPIGNSQDHFTGSLDGDGFRIYNLGIEGTQIAGEAVDGDDKIGLFGDIDGSNIANLKIEGIFSGGRNVGSLVGVMRNSNLTNIEYNTDVEGTGAKVGGLIGRVTENTNIINVTGNTQVLGTDDNVGGLIGKCDDDVVGNVNIENVLVSGNVKGEYYYIGGLIGYNVGELQLKIVDSSFEGIVDSRVGYSIGYFGGIGGKLDNTQILRSYVGAVIYGGVSNSGGILGGGLNSEIIDSYFIGDIRLLGINNNENIGGIIGGANTVDVRDSYFKGDIVDSGGSNDKAFGGMIGKGVNSYVDDCFFIGEIIGADDDVGTSVGKVESNVDVNEFYYMSDITDCIGDCNQIIHRFYFYDYNNKPISVWDKLTSWNSAYAKIDLPKLIWQGFEDFSTYSNNVVLEFIEPTPKHLKYITDSSVQLNASIYKDVLTTVKLDWNGSVENMSFDRLLFASSFDSAGDFSDWSRFENEPIDFNLANDDDESNSDWLVNGNSYYSIDDYYDGTQSVKVRTNSDFNGYYISDDAVSKNTNYSIKFWLRNPTSKNGKINVFGTNLETSGITLGGQNVSAYQNWTEFSFVWESGNYELAPDLRIEEYHFGGTDTDYIFIDNFEFSEMSDNRSMFTDGKYDGGLYFDGVNDYLEYGNNIAEDMRYNDISFFTWMQGSYISNQQIIAAFNSPDGGNKLLIGHGKNVDTFGIYDGTSWYYSSSSVFDSNWHHVGFTLDYDTKVLYIYVDGVNVGEARSNIDFTGEELFSIGMEYDAGLEKGDYYRGKLDEIRMFNRVLLPHEIDFLYKTNLKKVNGNLWNYQRKMSDLSLGYYNYTIEACQSILTCDSENRLFKKIGDDAKTLNITELDDNVINNVKILKYNITNLGEMYIENMSLSIDNEDFIFDYNISNESGVDIMSSLESESLYFGKTWTVDIYLTLENDSSTLYNLTDYDSSGVLSDNSEELDLGYKIRINFSSYDEVVDQKRLDFTYNFKCNASDGSFKVNMGSNDIYYCQCEANGIFCKSGSVCPCISAPTQGGKYGIGENVTFDAGESFFADLNFFGSLLKYFKFFPLVSASADVNYSWNLTNGVFLNNLSEFNESFDIPGKYVVDLEISKGPETAGKDITFYVTSETEPYCIEGNFWLLDTSYLIIKQEELDPNPPEAVSCYNASGINRKSCCPIFSMCSGETENAACSAQIHLDVQSCIDYKTPKYCNGDVYGIAEYSIEAKNTPPSPNSNFCGTIINVIGDEFIYASACRCEWINEVCVSLWNESSYLGGGLESMGTCKVETTNVIGNCEDDDFRIEELTATWSGTGDDTNCLSRSGPKKIDCGSVVGLSFFGWVSAVVSVLLIVLIYLLVLKKKK